LIKRFELFFDLSWKYFKIILSEKFKIEDKNSPNAVFQTCLKVGILSEEEARNFIETISLRNKTVHLYKEEESDCIAKIILEKHENFFKIIQNNSPENLANK
jgi:uncharacterized protein YutE (UPF0331/DUF86 family)